MQTKITKSRRGWTVAIFNEGNNTWTVAASFFSQTEAMAYAYRLEKGL